MKIHAVLLVAGLLNALPLATARAAEPLAVCPDVTLAETAEDCPWAGAARTLSQAAESGEALRPVLKDVLPKIEKELRADARLGHWQELWGRSINYDELAKGIIVDPAILDLIFKIARAPLRQERIVHAGLEHTYGYLFSTLKTAFGYKRARWVREDIETGFSLPRGSLGPLAESGGTLFANASYFAGHIAFRNDARELQVLNRHSHKAARVLREFNYGALKPARLEETVTLGDRKLVIRTDLVPFTHVEAGQANAFLLVYSYRDSRENRGAGGAKLVTAFPVARSFVDMVLNPETMGEAKPVISRYNAFVAGLTDSPVPVLGARKITSPLQ